MQTTTLAILIMGEGGVEEDAIWDHKAKVQKNHGPVLMGQILLLSAHNPKKVETDVFFSCYKKVKPMKITKGGE